MYSLSSSSRSSTYEKLHSPFRYFSAVITLYLLFEWSFRFTAFSNWTYVKILCEFHSSPLLVHQLTTVVLHTFNYLLKFEMIFKIHFIQTDKLYIHMSSHHLFHLFLWKYKVCDKSTLPHLLNVINKITFSSITYIIYRNYFFAE